MYEASEVLKRYHQIGIACCTQLQFLEWWRGRELYGDKYLCLRKYCADQPETFCEEMRGEESCVLATRT